MVKRAQQESAAVRLHDQEHLPPSVLSRPVGVADPRPHHVRAPRHIALAGDLALQDHEPCQGARLHGRVAVGVAVGVVPIGPLVGEEEAEDGLRLAQ